MEDIPEVAEGFEKRGSLLFERLEDFGQKRAWILFEYLMYIEHSESIEDLWSSKSSLKDRNRKCPGMEGITIQKFTYNKNYHRPENITG